MAGGAGSVPSRLCHGALAWGLTALLGLAGCAGAQAPTAAEQQAGEAPRVTLAAPTDEATAPESAAPETPPP
ncbi:MAG: hypothetical protein WBF84_16180, partial [Castellaniella sp.]